ncbi:hypothetical protein L916_16901 [Phytophthora nicotianae]|uniref:Uncharacterized protein n=1 Tax=Phytophthora nicotianae TaxID=4792 RepID=W2I9M3_PHYNI|nr:hypothetical protein L916_16901 [Phytophthora nicotianae]
MKELRISKVVNYEYAPASTVDKRGARTVWIKFAGKS